MTKRFWAVGLKGWVQIRSAAKPPRAVPSAFTYEVERMEGGYWDFYDRQLHGGHLVKRQVKCEQVVHEGGTILYTLPTRTFNRLSKVRVKKGEVLALSPDDHILTVLKRKEGKRVRLDQTGVADRRPDSIDQGGRRE